MAYRIHVAKANAESAKLAKAKSPFSITIRFQGGLTENQEKAFELAASRWCRVIVGDLPPVMIDGEKIDDVLILAQGREIDGPGTILGQAGPTHLRPKSSGAAAYLPARGEMVFDSADLEQMEQNGTLNDVITHEMGHVLGFGTVWQLRKVLKSAGGDNPRFTGQQAMAEYSKLMGAGQPAPVPVEASGGAGTRDSHWRDTLFGNELMTGWVNEPPPNPLSRLTVASMADIGYAVDLGASELYEMPSLRHIAAAGLLMAGSSQRGLVLPRVPMILDNESLVKA